MERVEKGEAVSAWREKRRGREMMALGGGKVGGDYSSGEEKGEREGRGDSS